MAEKTQEEERLATQTTHGIDSRRKEEGGRRKRKEGDEVEQRNERKGENSNKDSCTQSEWIVFTNSVARLYTRG